MKLRFLVLAVLAVSPALAGPRDDVIDTLVKCHHLKDGQARLACFDQAGPQLEAAAGTPAVAASAPPPPVTEAAPPPAQDRSVLDMLNPFGGAPSKAGPAVDPMAYQPIGSESLPLTMGVAEYTVLASGSFTVTLDNGQVWREHDRDFATPLFKRNEKNVVVIDHALMGGYTLAMQNTATLYKVVRVK